VGLLDWAEITLLMIALMTGAWLAAKAMARLRRRLGREQPAVSTIAPVHNPNGYIRR